MNGETKIVKLQRKVIVLRNLNYETQQLLGQVLDWMCHLFCHGGSEGVNKYYWTAWCSSQWLALVSIQVSPKQISLYDNCSAVAADDVIAAQSK